MCKDDESKLEGMLKAINLMARVMALGDVRPATDAERAKANEYVKEMMLDPLCGLAFGQARLAWAECRQAMADLG